MRKMNAKLITPNNYKILGQSITYIRTGNLPDILPRDIRPIVIEFNTQNAIDLYAKLNQAVAKLSKGESVILNTVKVKQTIDAWAADEGGKPIVFSVYVKEILTKYRKLEGHLDDIGSDDPVELEYYLNALSPIMSDLLMLVRVLLDKR